MDGEVRTKCVVVYVLERVCGCVYLGESVCECVCVLSRILRHTPRVLMI